MVNTALDNFISSIPVEVNASKYKLDPRGSHKF